MESATRKKISWIIGSVLTAGILAGFGGCTNNDAQNPPAQADSQTQAPVQAVVAQPIGQPGQDQKQFASDDEAVKALVAAAKALDHSTVHEILGPAWKELMTGDKVQDEAAFNEFAAHAAEHSRIEKKDASTSILYVGVQDWPFPIPVKKASDGKWFFDTEAGKEEILNRHIGADELEAIQICHAYVQAQRDYASADHDGSGVLKYAQRILSEPGKKDGLYWKVDPGQLQSPFGPLLGQAELEGYEKTSGKKYEPYHGYHFRVLKEQGADAAGGKYSYVINGNMIAGFALVAFPAEYDQGGIMTFIVNQQGKIYQKDLGKYTNDLGWKMTEYNPDSTWTLVTE